MIDRGDITRSFSERVEGGGGGGGGVGGHWSHLHITNWIPFHVLHDDMLLHNIDQLHISVHIEHIEILIFTSKLNKVIPI